MKLKRLYKEKRVEIRVAYLRRAPSKTSNIKNSKN
jgi:hypothetical protein